MIMPALIERVEQLIQPLLQELGTDLVELKVNRSGPTMNVQILVDKVHGGISLAECSQLNREIGEAIERENLIGQHYVLEVSSPGLDRPLRTKKDFMRVVGREIHLFLSEGVAGKMEYRGLLREIREEHLIIGSTGEGISVPLEKVNQGKQII